MRLNFCEASERLGALLGHKYTQTRAQPARQQPGLEINKNKEIRSFLCKTYHKKSVKREIIHHITSTELDVSPKSLNLLHIRAWMQTVNVSFFRPT